MEIDVNTASVEEMLEWFAKRLHKAGMYTNIEDCRRSVRQVTSDYSEMMIRDFARMMQSITYFDEGSSDPLEN